MHKFLDTIPAKFYSRNQLVNLYLEKGDRMKACVVVKERVLKEVEILFGVIESIQYETANVGRSYFVLGVELSVLSQRKRRVCFDDWKMEH